MPTRRSLPVAVGGAGFAGCSGPFSGGDDGTDEECDAPFVIDRHLPDDIAAEVDTTFEDGADVTDSEVPYGQAVSNDTLLLRNGTYWTHRTERTPSRALRGS